MCVLETWRTGLGLVAALAWFAGCGFDVFATSGDAGDAGDAGDDNRPMVFFTAASSSVDEAAGAVSIEVALSAAAEVPITVSITRGGSAALADASSDTTVTFLPGSTSENLEVSILDDQLAEGNELLSLDLTTSSAMLGSVTRHDLTILDDDATCYGTGAYSVCFATPPPGTTNLPPTIATDSSPACESAQPIGWTANGQPEACFVIGDTIAAITPTRVTGSRPLVLVAAHTIVVTARIDAGSRRLPASIGPGAPNTLRHVLHDRRRLERLRRWGRRHVHVAGGNRGARKIGYRRWDRRDGGDAAREIACGLPRPSRRGRR
ncbi:MAG: Calx-beta domain-containing protein [Kofleriaceae bacterium]